MICLVRTSIASLLILLFIENVPVAAEELAAEAVAPKADKAKPAEEPKKAEEAKKDVAAKPATHQVKRELLTIEIEADGVFEARNLTEIALRPQEWSSFPVLKAVPHGSRVKRGEVLVTLDTEKIDQAIADLRADQHLASISMKLAELQLRLLETSLPLDLAAGQRSRRIAAEDLQRFQEIDRPNVKKGADFGLKMAEQTLEYEQEELRQLEKMYKADDLTEET